MKKISRAFLSFVFLIFCFVYKSSGKVERSRIYEERISPLTTKECARCHYSVFLLIKEKGTKHQLDCTYCHKEYHIYRPDKIKNYKDVLPKCVSCHGEIHGKKLTNCTLCHTNAHAPKLSITGIAELGKHCVDCHKKEAEDIKTHPSAHLTEVSCKDCHHTKHGYIPQCSECHSPHVEGQKQAECLACHPVHTPLVISYAKDTPNNICGACHEKVFSKLSACKKKHHDLACAFCHTKHGYIPKCQKCHGIPHSERLIKQFKGCSDCHGSAHTLEPEITAKKPEK